MKKLLISSLILLFGFTGLIAQEEQKKSDFMFSLGGGSIHKEFTLNGDIAYATKLNFVLLQTSAYVNRNSFIQDYGASAGLGLEGKRFGIYGFFDGLSRKVKGYKDVFHYQVRPTTRYQGNKFSLSLFYAFPLSHRILLEEDISDPIFWQNSTGYYYSIETSRLWSVALKYIGGELEVVPFNFLKLSGKGLIADKKTYQLTLGTELKLFNWFSFNAEYVKFRLGEHFSIAWQNYDAFRFGGIVRFGGGRDVFRDMTQRRIITPQYPFIVNEIENQRKDVKISDILRAGATGTPEKGCAPLVVRFQSFVSGGVVPYRYFWDFKDGTTSNESNPIHTFYKEGTYCVEFNAYDSAGHMDAVCICIIVQTCLKTQDDPCKGVLINNFQATTTSVKKGESVSLNWNISGADGLKLNGAWVDFVGNKIIVMNTLGSFSYTLDAFKDGVVCKGQTITINVVDCTLPIIPIIGNFSVNPDVLELAEGAIGSTTLTWSIMADGTAGVITTVLITGAGKTFTTFFGSEKINITDTTTFTMIITSINKCGERKITTSKIVTVTHPNCKTCEKLTFVGGTTYITYDGLPDSNISKSFSVKNSSTICPFTNVQVKYEAFYNNGSTEVLKYSGMISVGNIGAGTTVSKTININITTGAITINCHYKLRLTIICN